MAQKPLSESCVTLQTTQEWEPVFPLHRSYQIFKELSSETEQRAGEQPQQEEDYAPPSEPPSPHWRTRECLELPLDNKAFSNTLCRLRKEKIGSGRDKEHFYLFALLLSPGAWRRLLWVSRPTSSFTRFCKCNRKACHALKRKLCRRSFFQLLVTLCHQEEVKAV